MILIYDVNDGMWESKGNFKTAKEDNDDINFLPTGDGKFNLDILCVSLPSIHIFLSGLIFLQSFFNPLISLSAIAPAAVHHRMLSLQAGAASTPVASTSASTHSRSPSVSTTAIEESSSQSPFTAHELELIDELDIPMCLTRQVPGKSLRNFWERYQAGLAAITKSSKMKKKPTEKSITNIFIGKSQWFNWSKVFIKVKQYGGMVKWLNEADDALNDKDVWKVELDYYTLLNLKFWLDNGGKLVDKGKGKAKVCGEEEEEEERGRVVSLTVK